VQHSHARANTLRVPGARKRGVTGREGRRSRGAGPRASGTTEAWASRWARGHGRAGLPGGAGEPPGSGRGEGAAGRERAQGRCNTIKAINYK
jgi:hypothetical protein